MSAIFETIITEFQKNLVTTLDHISMGQLTHKRSRHRSSRQYKRAAPAGSAGTCGRLPEISLAVDTLALGHRNFPLSTPRCRLCL